MTIHAHLTTFHGLPVHHVPAPPIPADELTPEEARLREASGDPAEKAMRELPAAGAVAWSLAVEPWEAVESWTECFDRFRSHVDLSEVRALVVGSWGEAYESSSATVIEKLLEHRAELPALRALFLGDMTGEDAEISWIQQSDVTGLFAGFPELEELGIRGGAALALSPVRHENLRSLTIETGGLPAAVVRSVGASDFPALTHLELWLGVDTYGGDSTIADLAPLLSGERLPALTHLGLRDSEQQDLIAEAVAAAPVVDRLDSLDLSLGVLSDRGAEALLAAAARLTHLRSLDLHHNFLTDEVRERLRTALEPAGVALDLDEGDAHSWDDGDTTHRFVSVSE
ncbi:STM4015 family protein [Streptomyces sp. NRRL F-5630]|uniref:STM4015 family protein n=1 Tax=unclassified Streptomyces TaxID=2593676 RepID=UPI0004C9EDDD|nr:STM4015 family protein [Streptomyces sp. NRRL F-5630]